MDPRASLVTEEEGNIDYRSIPFLLLLPLLLLDSLGLSDRLLLSVILLFPRVLYSEYGICERGRHKQRKEKQKKIK